MSILDEYKEINTDNSKVDFSLIEEKARIDITVDIAEPESALKIGSALWGTLGNFSVIMGKAKSKKTFLVTAAAAAAIGNKTTLDNIIGALPNGKNIVYYFDTEQSKYHVLKLARRAVTLAGHSFDTDKFRVYALRAFNTQERFEFINKKLTEDADGVGLVIIDGVRDLLRDINSPDEATVISDALLRWTENKDLHIVTILHANKTDGNLRGHIGTELLNKAEAIIKVEADDKNKNISIVSCERSRNKDFEEFAFQINMHGLPTNCDMPVKTNGGNEKVQPKQLSNDAHKKMIIDNIENVAKPCRKGTLTDSICDSLEELGWGSLGKRKGEQFLRYWITNGWVINNGTEKKSDYAVKKYPVD